KSSTVKKSLRWKISSSYSTLKHQLSTKLLATFLVATNRKWRLRKG
ncbi:ABC transporter family protein, partial [Vibrio parahaemolyticus V-223/04]